MRVPRKLPRQPGLRVQDHEEKNIQDEFNILHRFSLQEFADSWVALVEKIKRYIEAAAKGQRIWVDFSSFILAGGKKPWKVSRLSIHPERVWPMTMAKLEIDQALLRIKSHLN